MVWVNTLSIVAIIVQQYTGFDLDIEMQATILSLLNILLRFDTVTGLNTK